MVARVEVCHAMNCSGVGSTPFYDVCLTYSKCGLRIAPSKHSKTLHLQAEEDSELRYAYNAEWDDPMSGNKMAFTLLHWPQSSEAELVRRLPLAVTTRYCRHERSIRNTMVQEC